MSKNTVAPGLPDRAHQDRAEARGQAATGRRPPDQSRRRCSSARTRSCRVETGRGPTSRCGSRQSFDPVQPAARHACSTSCAGLRPCRCPTARSARALDALPFAPNRRAATQRYAAVLREQARRRGARRRVPPVGRARHRPLPPRGDAACWGASTRGTVKTDAGEDAAHRQLARARAGHAVCGARRRLTSRCSARSRAASRSLTDALRSLDRARAVADRLRADATTRPRPRARTATASPAADHPSGHPVPKVAAHRMGGSGIGAPARAARARGAGGAGARRAPGARAHGRRAATARCGVAHALRRTLRLASTRWRARATPELQAVRGHGSGARSARCAPRSELGAAARARRSSQAMKLQLAGAGGRALRRAHAPLTARRCSSCSCSTAATG